MKNSLTLSCRSVAKNWCQYVVGEPWFAMTSELRSNVAWYLSCYTFSGRSGLNHGGLSNMSQESVSSLGQLGTRSLKNVQLKGLVLGIKMISQKAAWPDACSRSIGKSILRSSTVSCSSLHSQSKSFFSRVQQASKGATGLSTRRTQSIPEILP